MSHLIRLKIKSKANKLHQKALEHYSKGNCKKLLNNYKGAIADFTLAIKYNPKFAEAYFKRANTKLILNDSSGAQKDYDKAIELKPYFAQTLKSQLLSGTHFKIDTFSSIQWYQFCLSLR